MSIIKEILTHTAHRPFNLPCGQWKYYQEWNNTVFLHWQIPVEAVRELVPPELDIDCYNGSCYVSLVGFTMQNIRPRYLPSISFISDFNEINLRTYVVYNGKSGVYFLNIEAAKSISVFIAKHLSGLPYEKAVMARTETTFTSRNNKKGFYFDASFDIKEMILNKTALDKWLTERYCLYLKQDGKVFCYDIHHQEWSLRTININLLSLNYRIGSFKLSGQLPDLANYSGGVKVLSWQKLET